MALNDIDSAVESFSKALVLEPNDGELQEFLFYSSLFCFLHMLVCSFGRNFASYVL